MSTLEDDICTCTAETRGCTSFAHLPPHSLPSRGSLLRVLSVEVVQQWGHNDPSQLPIHLGQQLAQQPHGRAAPFSNISCSGYGLVRCQCPHSGTCGNLSLPQLTVTVHGQPTGSSECKPSATQGPFVACFCKLGVATGRKVLLLLLACISPGVSGTDNQCDCASVRWLRGCA